MISSSHFFQKELFLDDIRSEDVEMQEVGPWIKNNSISLNHRAYTEISQRLINASKSRGKAKTIQNERGNKSIRKPRHSQEYKPNTQRLELKEIIPDIRLPFISKTPFEGARRYQPRPLPPRKLTILPRKVEEPTSVHKKLKHIPLLRELNSTKGKRRKQAEKLMKRIQEKLKRNNEKSLRKSYLFALFPSSK